MQSRLTGKPAQDIYPSLNISQRISFASNLGRAFRDLSSTTTPSPGPLDFQDSSGLEAIDFFIPPALSSTYAFIKSRLASQHGHNAQCALFRQIIDELDTQGLFQDNRFHLTHLGITPQNLLISVPNRRTTSLSGILGWHRAIFVPRFLGCGPPTWLWNEPGCEVVKLTFDQAVGKVWCWYAYDETYGIARDILRLAILGVDGDEDLRVVEGVM